MKYFLSLFLSILCLRSFSQEIPEAGHFKVIGKVVDSASLSPLPYATITLYRRNNSHPVNGALTDSTGNFKITDLSEGVYKIAVRFIGYQSVVIDGVILNKKALNVGAIHLAPSLKVLEQVTVTTPQKLIENDIDKIVYHADKDITSQGGVATDVLRKVPMVSVDVDGNVEIEGNSSIRVLINGKPSTMFGANLTEALQSIPASQIKDVEVITLPGAKYDAQGSGGILNIILKDNKAKGVSGNISITTGSRLQNGSARIDYRRNNFGINAAFSGHTMIRSTTQNHLERLDFDTTGMPADHLLQNGSGSLLRQGYDFRVGFNWDITPRDNFSGTFDHDHFGINNNGSLRQQEIFFNSTPESDIYRSTQNNFNEYSSEIDLSYQKKFHHKDQELDALVTYNPGRNTAFFLDNEFDSSLNTLTSAAKSNDPGKDNETIASVDYTQPIRKNTKLETGVKGTYDLIASNTAYDVWNNYSKSYLSDSSRSNDFIYHQNVLAGYVSVTSKLFNFLDVEAGSRYERTNLNAVFSAARQNIFPGYNTLVPSAIVSHTFRNKQILKLGYSKRIERPEFRDLNPFINASDPTNITTGNPTLGPEIHNRIELGYSTHIAGKAMMSITLFSNRSAHDIQPYIVYYPSLAVGDTTYKNVAVTTRENIGVEENMGMNLFVTYSLNNKIDLRSNIFIFDKNITNRFIPGNSFNSVDYRLNLNMTYQFTPQFVGEFFGYFRSRRTEIQGKYPSFSIYNIAFKKMIFHKKGSIGLTATNPFGKYINQRSELSGQQFTLTSSRQIPLRSFGLSFTCNFGKIQYKKSGQNDQMMNAGDNSY